jgi:hypothetical protein
MYTELDIYRAFRKAQSSANNRGYRLPNDWVKHFSEKLTENQQFMLTRMSKYFSTVWADIDLDKYFDCGFELYPKLNYHLFFKKQIMDLYKRKDKMLKNDNRNMKLEIVRSCIFVKSYMRDKEYRNLFNDYCKLIVDDRHVIVDHYLRNDVRGYFLCWMIAEGYINVYDYEFVLPSMIKNYRAMYAKLKGNMEFLNERKKKME